MIRERVEEKLRAALEPMFFEVVNESYCHNVPAGSENHFKVVLASDRFTGERSPSRHWMIYSALTAGLSTTVHALALHIYAIKGWEALQDTISASSPYRGAGSIAQKQICNSRRSSSMLLQIMRKWPAGRFALSESWGSRTVFRQKLAGNREKSRGNVR